MTAFRGGGLVCVAYLLASALARAADVTDIDVGVRVAAPSCPIAPLPIAAFTDSLRVELAGRAPPPGATRVTLGIEPCDPGTTRVQVTVSNSATALALTREVGLEDVAPAARPRALALAVAELIRGVQSPSPPATSFPATPSVVTPASTPPLLTVAGDGLLSLFPQRHTVLWGGRLSLAVESPSWNVGAFAEAAAGERDYDVGQVRLVSVGAGVVAGPRWASGRVTFAPALVGALGWAHIQGHTGQPGVIASAGDGLTAAIRARIAVALALSPTTSVRLIVEGGALAHGFDATVDGARSAGLSGASIVVGLGFEHGR